MVLSAKHLGDTDESSSGDDSDSPDLDNGEDMVWTYYYLMQKQNTLT